MFLKPQHMLPIGMITLALGLLIGQFLPFNLLGFPISSFLEGLLIGLSIVLNITYLVSIRKNNPKN